MSSLLQALLGSETGDFPKGSSPPSPKMPAAGDMGDVGDGVSIQFSTCAIPIQPSGSPQRDRNRWPEQARPPMSLRRCGALGLPHLPRP
jgi:hypothetical protein